MEKSSDLYRVTEVELVYKYTVKPADRAVVGSAADAYKLLLSCWDEHKMELQEQFKVLLLNNSSHVLGLYHVSSGGMTGTVVDARLIYAAALKTGASAMIVAHNHPSGKLSPSSQDKSITEKLRDGGNLLDIRVLDHLIITPYNYYSFANEGLM